MMLQYMPELKKKNKKAQALNLVITVMGTLFTLIILYIALTLGAVKLRDANIFTAGTPEATDVNNTIRNFTSGGATFFSNIPTFFSILAIVTIIGILSVLVSYALGFIGTKGRAGL